MKDSTKTTFSESQRVANAVLEEQLYEEMVMAMQTILANAEEIVKDLGSKINNLDALSTGDLEDTCNQIYEDSRIISQNMEPLENYTSRLYPNPLFAEKHN